jgi:hypothetical protein
MPRCDCITQKGEQCLNAAKDGQRLCGIHLNHGCLHKEKHILKLKFKLSLRNVDDGKMVNFSLAPPKFMKDTLKMIKTDTIDYYLPNAMEWENNDENELIASVKKVNFLKESPQQLLYLMVQIESNKPLNHEIKRDLANSIINYDDDGNYGITIDNELYLVNLKLMK